MAIQTMQNDNGLKDITDLLALVKDQKTTSSTSTNITQAGVQAQINDILGANNGLAAVAGGQHAAGFYNSSVNTQMINDLLTRAASQVAAKNATVTTTQSKKAPLSAKDVLTTIGTLALKNPSKLKSLYQSAHDYLYGPNAVGADSPVAPDVVGNSELSADLSGNLSDAISGGTNLNVTSSAAGDTGNVTQALSDLFDEAGYSAAGTDAATSALGAESVGTLPAGYTDAAVADTIPGAIGADGTAAAAGSTADVAGLTAADSAAASGDAAGGVGEGFSSLGAAGAGWTALALYGAADLNQDIHQGNNDVLAADAIGGLGTGDILQGFQKDGSIGDKIATAAGPAAGLVNNIEDKVGGGWIVCTELLKQNRMPKEYYVPGLRVFQSYRSDLLDGYYIWARPAVALLKAKPFCLRSRFISYIFNKRAEYLASIYGVKTATNTVTGQVISAIVYGFCYVLGQYLKWSRKEQKQGEFA